jgi:hypothetical protein
MGNMEGLEHAHLDPVKLLSIELASPTEEEKQYKAYQCVAYV